jgi:SAM-dependent methyltransferase
MGNEWFEHFFHGIANECWRKCVSPEGTRAEVDFLEKALARRPGDRLLDVPCGGGRHALEFSRRGYRMTGLDLSAEFIAEARAADQGKQVQWICSDMRKLDRKAEFDGAFSMGNAFGYLEHSDTERFLAALSRALKPGARFILNTGAVAECLLPRFKEHEVHQIEDIKFIEHNTYDIATSCVLTEYTFERDGKAEKRPGRQCIYTAAEIQRMLARAAINIVAIHSSIEQASPQLGTNEMYFVGQKKLD